MDYDIPNANSREQNNQRIQQEHEKITKVKPLSNYDSQRT